MESFSRYLVLVLCSSFFVSTTLAAVVCPSGWATYENGVKCYKLFVDTQVNYATAKQACVNEGAHLATVSSQEEHNFILNNVWPSITNAYVYLGGSDAAVEGTWEWVDGSTWSFESWGVWNRQQLPVHGDVHNCLAMTSATDVNGDWYDFLCTNPADYMCEKAATITTMACPSQSVDGRNWHLINDKCYFLVRGMKNWAQSEKNCVNMAAHLASVHDQTTNDYFMTTWVQRFGRGMWIGLNDKITDQTFVWSDGTSSAYTNWAVLNGVQQPENNNLKNCVGLESPTRGLAGQWNDYKCAMRAWSICQIDAIP